MALGYGLASLAIAPGEGEPGPGFLPAILSLCLAASAVTILTRGLRARRGTRVETHLSAQACDRGERVRGVEAPEAAGKPVGTELEEAAQGPEPAEMAEGPQTPETVDARSPVDEPMSETTPTSAETMEDGERPGPVRAPVRLPWIAAALTLFYALLLEPVGFAPSTLAYSAAMTFLFGRRGWALALAPVLLTLALYLFFRAGLGVRLPAGPLG